MNTRRSFCCALILLLLIVAQPRSAVRADAGRNYINYRWEQGFGAVNGYVVLQDRKGYIWAGTENGLMRFNGYDFKTYTTRDGLPDNEILGLWEDSTNRLWLLPFANSIAYVRNGKIHNEENDTLVKRLCSLIDIAPSHIFCDREGTIWICRLGGSLLIRLDRQGVARKINLPVTGGILWLSSSGRLKYTSGNRVFCWEGKDFKPDSKMPINTGYTFFCNDTLLYDYQQGKMIYHTDGPHGEIFAGVNTVPAFAGAYYIWYHPGYLYFSGDNGIRILDIHTKRFCDSILPGHKVGSFVKARDNSYWLGTIGKGLFRVSQIQVKTPVSGIGKPNVLYIKGKDAGVQYTTDKTMLVDMQLDKDGRVQREKITRLNKTDSFEYYVFAGQAKKDQWILCGNQLTLKDIHRDRVLKRYRVMCKSAFREEDGHLLVGLSEGIVRVNLDNFEMKYVSLFRDRMVALTKVGDVIYAGTLRGLVAISPGRPLRKVQEHNPLLEKHITALCTGRQGMLWCANHKGELVALKNDRVLAVIGLAKGLQCNRISCLRISDTLVWVGTDNGLFAIQQQPPYNIVRHITYATGLGSNQVNCLDIHKGRIWVGTIHGVNYFNEDEILLARDSTEIIINSLMSGDRELMPSAKPLLLQGKTLSIDFDVVDFSGGARPVFEYRIGGDKEWKPLSSNHLYFPALPYGEFTVFIRAFAPNWTEGAGFSQEFYHPPPFYRRWWFLLLAGIAAMVLLLLAVLFIIKRVRRRDRQQLAVKRNLLRLEQMALQGQMSPHFIFNCIAAIKQYYNVGQLDRANSFVDAFSQLIRQTFEMGTETFIPLDQEIGYLTHYLNVERTRFHDSFRYTITRNTELADREIMVPAMLLQPIVENAVRHGIRHLPDGEGLIRITVTQKGAQISFEITDNGIGHSRSRELSGYAGFDKVTSSTINEKRIRILNRLCAGSIIMHTQDVLAADGTTCTGTSVTITYPTYLNRTLNHESNYY